MVKTKPKSASEKRPPILEKTRLFLWVAGGGRCHYCNIPLWRDDLTLAQMNKAYIAHIISWKKEGPRGHATLSSKLAIDPSNLMLMCDAHHRMIDDKNRLEEFSVERLQAMKLAHEKRIARLTAIKTHRKTEILLYGANVGQHAAPVSYSQSAEAIAQQEFYPDSEHGISLGMVNSVWQDRDSDFWEIESRQLNELVDRQVVPGINTRDIQHLSVFAFAPQPLLVLLGSRLSDIPAIEVYQRHREPVNDWKWKAHPEGFDYKIIEPEVNQGEPVLVIALSATIIPERVRQAMTGAYSQWEITIDTPHNDFLKSREQLALFRMEIRQLLDRIKAKHGQDKMLHVFPAMPVAAAVELGRILQKKADLPLRIYDQNFELGGFVPALDVGRLPVLHEGGKD